MPRLSQRDADRAHALYRAQRIHGAFALVLLLVLLLGVPTVFVLWPELDHIRLGGMPLSWLMVAVLPFPVMVALAWWQLRQAERLEDRG